MCWFTYKTRRQSVMIAVAKESWRARTVHDPSYYVPHSMEVHYMAIKNYMRSYCAS